MANIKIEDIMLNAGAGIEKGKKYRILEKHVQNPTTCSFLVEEIHSGLQTTRNRGEKSFITSHNTELLLIEQKEDLNFI
ncbi:MAG: hypothetical protein WBP45_09760 [Daejeonella sp.]